MTPTPAPTTNAPTPLPPGQTFKPTSVPTSAPTKSPTKSPTVFYSKPKPESSFKIRSPVDNAHKTPGVNELEQAMFDALKSQQVSRDLIIATKRFFVQAGIKFAIGGQSVKGFRLSEKYSSVVFSKLFGSNNFVIIMPRDLEEITNQEPDAKRRALQEIDPLFSPPLQVQLAAHDAALAMDLRAKAADPGLGKRFQTEYNTLYKEERNGTSKTFPDLFVLDPEVEMVVEYKITSKTDDVVIAPTAAQFKTALLARVASDSPNQFNLLAFEVETLAPTALPTSLPTPLPPGATHFPTAVPTEMPTDMPTTSVPTRAPPPDVRITLSSDVTDAEIYEGMWGGVNTALLQSAMFKTLTELGTSIDFDSVVPTIEYIIDSKLRFDSSVYRSDLIEDKIYRHALGAMFSVDQRKLAVIVQDASGPFEYLRVTTTTTTATCEDVYCGNYNVAESDEVFVPIATWTAARGQDTFSTLRTDVFSEAERAGRIVTDPGKFTTSIMKGYEQSYFDFTNVTFSAPRVLVGKPKIVMAATFVLVSKGNESIVPPTAAEFTNALKFWRIRLAFSRDAIAKQGTSVNTPTVQPTVPQPTALRVTIVPTTAPTKTPTTRPVPQQTLSPTPPPTPDWKWGKAADSGAVSMGLLITLISVALTFCF